MADPTIEEIALEQRAVNPREPVAPAPAPEPDPVADPVEPADGVEPEPVPEPAVKPRKTAEEVLKGRVGHLTKTLSERGQELEDYRSKLAAAEALLAAANAAPEGIPPVATSATTSTTYSPADFEAAVSARAEAQEFNRRADDMYNTGATKYSDWKDSIDTLVASGFMDKTLLEAAMAVDDGSAVLHHLGVNLDEAERINALPPVRKAAEMAKLSVQLNAPVSVPVSSAPAPIKPVSGSPSPQVDLQRIADDNDMRAYAAARAKQGSRWAR